MKRRIMKYDFITVPDRRGQDCLAADKIPYDDITVKEGFDPIPMWIADMTFVNPPFIRESVMKRLEVPHYGYFGLPEAYFDAVIRWQEVRHGVKGLKKEYIGYENGVLGGVASAVSAFTAPGEKILIHSPTYVGFTGVLKSLGRPAEESPLVRDENGVWRMDFEDMERRLEENRIHCAIFCSPHNPSGRVWEEWEVKKAMEVYAAHDCVVISDEIWSDIIMPGYTHVPSQSVSEDARNRTMAFYSTSKTFSLAGLIGSYHIVYNPYLRDKLEKQGSMTHYNDCNLLSLYALLGAYTAEGMEWADEMCSVVNENIKTAAAFFNGIPGVSVMPSQGTYMLYADVNGYCGARGITPEELRRRGVEVGVIWQNGDDFKVPGTVRINLALPHSRLLEALDRLEKYVFI